MMIDLQSMKLTVALWLLVLASAFAVVYVSHTARNAFIEWQALLDAAQSADVEWGRLLIEKSSSSSYSRLEGLAKEQLHMSVPTGERMILLKPEGVR
jgi:cell division protein FtsL